ncbi:hypothetical protein PENTCL1PPCAC_3543, partial [Pristionchus entomophagus]
QLQAKLHLLSSRSHFNFLASFNSLRYRGSNWNAKCFKCGEPKKSYQTMLGLRVFASTRQMMESCSTGAIRRVGCSSIGSE